LKERGQAALPNCKYSWLNLDTQDFCRMSRRVLETELKEMLTGKFATSHTCSQEGRLAPALSFAILLDHGAQMVQSESSRSFAFLHWKYS
jgi:hypothetical protein